MSFIDYTFTDEHLCKLPIQAPDEFLLFLKPNYQSSYCKYVGEKKIRKEDGYIKGEIYNHMSQSKFKKKKKQC